ncbi:MAG: hypothetical protein ACYCY7_09145 [Gallionella sp.]
MIKEMSFLKKFGELIIFGLIAGVVIAGCGGGGSSSSMGLTQSYTSSAGAGDVMQFNVNTTNMTYSFHVVETSYAASSAIPAASAVLPTESSTGILTGKNAVGSYNVAASADGFILGGEVFPIQNGLFVGHVIIAPIGGNLRKIPIFGVSSPITTLAGLAGTYNDQGFGCAGRSGGDVTGGSVQCASHTGTIQVSSSGAFTTCRDGNLGGASAPSCTTIGGGTAASTLTGQLYATATPGVYDFKTTADGYHRGWVFAFTASGQNVAVIDHDDDYAPEFGHSIAVSQASVISGQADGNYFVKNDIGQRHLMAVTGSNFTDTIDAGITASGTLIYDNPWKGLVSYQYNFGGASGVADIATVGAFTYTSNTYPYLFGVGIKY